MQRCWLVGCVVLVSGCDILFQVDELTASDAAIGIDYDEDGFYAEDNCPAIPNQDQHDDDKDGVGNVCDPHLDLFDTVVDREMFENEDSKWTAAGAWTKTPRAWQSPAIPGASTFVFPPQLFNRPTVQLGFTIDAFDITRVQRQVVVHLDAPLITGDCAFRYDTTAGAKSQIVTHVGTGTGSNLGTAVVPEYGPGVSVIGTYTRGGPTCMCRSDAVTYSRADPLPDEFSTMPTITFENIQVTLTHVTVYQVLPP